MVSLLAMSLGDRPERGGGWVHPNGERAWLDFEKPSVGTVWVVSLAVSISGRREHSLYFTSAYHICSS